MACSVADKIFERVINAELRQPRDERGMYLRPHFSFNRRNESFPDRMTFQTNLASTLTETMHTLIQYTSSERGRAVVPPITDATTISPFPFRVLVKVGNLELG